MVPPCACFISIFCFIFSCYISWTHSGDRRLYSCCYVVASIYLPSNSPAQDIFDELVDVGFAVISVKQMSSARRSPDASKPITLLLFLVTLPRTAKSQDIFKLSSLCHISIKVEYYKSQKHPYAVLQLPEIWPRLGQLQTNPPPAACGVGADTCTETARRKRMHLQPWRAATASWLKEGKHIPPTTAAVGMPRKISGCII
jgi:hypothetical protein